MVLASRVRLAALILAAAACASAPRDSAAVALRVATWNVENLFDEEDRREPPGQADEVRTPAQVSRKLERVGAVLRAIRPDVAVLQEVENLALVERLVAGPLAGLGYRAHLVDGADPRGIDVAVLSTVPVEQYVSHAGERDAGGAALWSRDLVEAHLRVGDHRVVVLATHLVSQRTPAKDARRERQARRAREIADAAASRWPDALVLVAGDLNDEPSDGPLAPLLADGVWVDLAARLPPDRSWTWAGLGRASRLDYVLVHRRSASAAARVQVWDGDGVRRASDHRPLVVDLVLR